MNAELPEGLTWIENGVIKCLRCKKQEDCRGAFQTLYPDFLEDHKTCIEDRGLAPASSMTIREVFAMHFMASMITNGQTPQTMADPDLEPQAIRFADTLLGRLSRGSP